MKSIKLYWLAPAFLLPLLIASCTKDTIDLPSGELDLGETTIWTGTTISFEKAPGADPTLAENQDRITDEVWITRGTSGGQIYNAVSESSADKDNSPEGTLWAIGTTDNLVDLTFDKFRATLDKPKSSVGIDLVLLLVEENIAIDLTITSWSDNQQGGFSYERSSN